MKKLINDPRAVVREMLEGLTDQAPGRALLDGEDVVIRAGLPPYEARCEVAAAGTNRRMRAMWVPECCTRQVCGDVFTSPSVDAVLAAIHALALAGYKTLRMSTPARS